MRALVAVAVACGSTAPPAPAAPQPVDCTEAVAAIAKDIEGLRHRFSQLADFSAVQAAGGCSLIYERHTHAPHKRGGWSSSVPAPDPDGAWLYIGLWDPADPTTMTQLNTQPAEPNWHIGRYKVTFLLLEGEQVTPAGTVIFAVLQRHGLVER